MAVLGATRIYTLDHFRTSLAQCLARMAGKGIFSIIIRSVDLVWLAHILVKDQRQHKKGERIQRQTDKTNTKEQKGQKTKKGRTVKDKFFKKKGIKRCANCWRHRRRS